MEALHCPRCQTVNFGSNRVCKNCKARLHDDVGRLPTLQRPGMPVYDQFESGPQTISFRQILGLAGSLILFLGVFAPIVRAPIFGSISYFNNGTGDGVVIIILAAISAYLTFSKNYFGLLIAGALSLAVLGFTFLMFRMRIASMIKEAQAASRDNPFASIGESMLSTVQLDWGWGVLIVGASLLIAAGVVKADSVRLGS